jgi:hypothetical protein
VYITLQEGPWTNDDAFALEPIVLRWVDYILITEFDPEHQGHVDRVVVLDDSGNAIVDDRAVVPASSEGPVDVSFVIDKGLPEGRYTACVHVRESHEPSGRYELVVREVDKA